MSVGPHGPFKIGARVEAPGFMGSRMTVTAYEWRESPNSRNLRGWWARCDCEYELTKVTCTLLLHPSWLVEISAVDTLGELVQ